MIACQFLGEKEVGLAAVLKKRFGVELDKRYQKADWSKRPLIPQMIEYAMEDTSLLIELHQQLQEELRVKGRLAWVEEECGLLTMVRMVSRGDEPLFIRFKGSAVMDGRTLAVLEEILRFRDEKARQRDVPAFKILGSETLRELAGRKPRKMGDLSGVPGLTPKLVERYGEGLLDAVARGTALPADRLPVLPRQPRRLRDRLQDERLQALKQWREKKSRELGIEPGILANNTLLEALSEADPGQSSGEEIPVPMKRWQKELFGMELPELLRNL